MSPLLFIAPLVVLLTVATWLGYKQHKQWWSDMKYHPVAYLEQTFFADKQKGVIWGVDWALSPDQYELVFFGHWVPDNADPPPHAEYASFPNRVLGYRPEPTMLVISNQKQWDNLKQMGLLVQDKEKENRGTVMYQGQILCFAFLDKFIPDDDEHIYLIKE